MGYQINGERLLRNLFTMAGFGQNEGGGIDRSLRRNGRERNHAYVVGGRTHADGEWR